MDLVCGPMLTSLVLRMCVVKACKICDSTQPEYKEHAQKVRHILQPAPCVALVLHCTCNTSEYDDCSKCNATKMQHMVQAARCAVRGS